MRFKLLGTEIYVSFLFFAVLTFMLLIDKTGLCFLCVFSFFVHEAGHLFACFLFESQPKSIKLVPASILITRSFERRKSGEILIALFGPLASLLTALTFFLNFRLTKNMTALNLSLINFIIFAFNLLPVNGLDGGTVLREIIKRKKGERKAQKTLFFLSLIIGVLTVFAAAYLCIGKRVNVSLLLLGVYFIVCSLLRAN